jgi:hypothetical protein
MANSQLRRDRHLDQSAAMVPPSVVVKDDGMGGWRFATHAVSRIRLFQEL